MRRWLAIVIALIVSLLPVIATGSMGGVPPCDASAVTVIQEPCPCCATHEACHCAEAPVDAPKPLPAVPVSVDAPRFMALADVIVSIVTTRLTAMRRTVPPPDAAWTLKGRPVPLFARYCSVRC